MNERTSQIRLRTEKPLGREDAMWQEDGSWYWQARGSRDHYGPFARSIDVLIDYYGAAFFVTVDGQPVYLSRSVSASHDPRVHEMLGTRSESELQELLDQCSYGDWWSEDGSYWGPDDDGLEVEILYEPPYMVQVRNTLGNWVRHSIWRSRSAALYQADLVRGIVHDVRGHLVYDPPDDEE